jgi:hypothetical protein
LLVVVVPVPFPLLAVVVDGEVQHKPVTDDCGWTVCLSLPGAGGGVWVKYMSLN